MNITNESSPTTQNLLFENDLDLDLSNSERALFGVNLTPQGL